MNIKSLNSVSIYEKKDCICFNGKSKGDERILSNYYPFDFNVGGVEFHSVEQYYHWKRFEGHPTEQAKILTYTGAKNAHESRHYAHIRTNQGKLIMDETKRIDIMREGLYAKINHCKEFKDYLLSTGSKELVEYITWDDKDSNDFWGAKSEGRGKQPTIKGRNVLGKLLMELRDRAVKKTAEKTPIEDDITKELMNLEYDYTQAEITPISTPVEPPTVEVAPTIQPTEKKPLKQPKKVEEQKHIYADSLLDRIKGDFIVRYRIEYRVEECRVDSYGEACDLYQQAQDIMTTSNNPCWLALFNGDDIIEIELYD